MDEVTHSDKQEEKVLLKHCNINYSMITEIYHWLQSKSKAFPWIDTYTFREYFIKDTNILGVKGFNM